MTSRSLSRSNGGCWTCRIRHRKCDETSPACKECTDRHIQCHGYGPEPDWVQNPARLQAELHRIKQAVKQNFRHNRKLQASRSTRTSVDSSPSASILHSSLEPIGGSSEFREAELLMYYLDYIFPLQYAYYVDNPATGGRGWLFWLLSKKGPLRHAALTLSALHQHSTSQNKTEEMQSELIRYHTNAMQELRQVLGNCETDGFATPSENQVEFLTCGTFLISFEIFQGGTTNWEPHLNALTSVASQMSPGNIGVFSRRNPHSDVGLQRLIDAAMRFLVAKLLWFDLFSCVATGKTPKLPYRLWLDLEQVDLSCVMGCQNWAMLALGDVAALDLELKAMDPDDLSMKLSNIENSLKEGLESLERSQNEARDLVTSQSITRIYATSILVQIRAMSAAEPKLDQDVYDAVEDVIKSLKKVPKEVSLKGVTWPLCIAGVMAKDCQRNFFENLLGNILKFGDNFTNCGTVLRILRESWKHQSESGVDAHAARNAMRRLDISALLA